MSNEMFRGSLRAAKEVLSMQKTLSKALKSLAVVVTAATISVPAQAAVVDFTLGVSSWSYGLGGGTGSTLPGVQGAGFTWGGKDVYFSGPFFTTAGSLTAIYSTVPTVYGPSDEPSATLGPAIFASGFSPRFGSVSNGTVGFKLADNYGFIRFDWNASNSTLTFLEGKYESVTNTAISTVSAVPLPAALPLLLAALGGLGFAARRRKAA